MVTELANKPIVKQIIDFLREIFEKRYNFEVETIDECVLIYNMSLKLFYELVKDKEVYSTNFLVKTDFFRKRGLMSIKYFLHQTLLEEQFWDDLKKLEYFCQSENLNQEQEKIYLTVKPVIDSIFSNGFFKVAKEDSGLIYLHHHDLLIDITIPKLYQNYLLIKKTRDMYNKNMIIIDPFSVILEMDICKLFKNEPKVIEFIDKKLQKALNGFLEYNFTFSGYNLYWYKNQIIAIRSIIYFEREVEQTFKENYVNSFLYQTNIKYHIIYYNHFNPISDIKKEIEDKLVDVPDILINENQDKLLDFQTESQNKLTHDFDLLYSNYAELMKELDIYDNWLLTYEEKMGEQHNLEQEMLSLTIRCEQLSCEYGRQCERNKKLEEENKQLKEEIDICDNEQQIMANILFDLIEEYGKLQDQNVELEDELDQIEDENNKLEVKSELEEEYITELEIKLEHCQDMIEELLDKNKFLTTKLESKDSRYQKLYKEIMKSIEHK